MSPHTAKKILIVDDEPDQCWALENLLRLKGLSAAATRRGAEVPDLIRKHPIELMILDAKLSDSEGLVLARRIKELKPDMKIVMVSGYYYGEDAEIREAIAAGFISAFVPRPFRHDDLIEKINDLLKTFPAPAIESMADVQ